MEQVAGEGRGIGDDEDQQRVVELDVLAVRCRKQRRAEDRECKDAEPVQEEGAADCQGGPQ